MALALDLKDDFLRRLATEAIPWSRRQLQPHIEKRLQILRQLVGRHYGENGAKERVPLNYIRMQTTILSRNLVSRSPRVMIETKDPALRAIASGTQLWAAELFDEIGLEKTLLRWNIEAILYPIGLLKVSSGWGVAPDGQPDMMRPRVDNVDAERSFWDMKATRWDRLHYIGHFTMIPKSAMTGEGWDEDRVRTLVAQPHNQIDEIGTEKTESLAQDGTYQGMDLYDDIECAEIFLPREGATVILALQGGTLDHRPLYVSPWLGPLNDTMTGPFHVLGYDEVPGNLLPSPPVHAIFDLHEAINVIARKLLNQAKRQKTTTIVQSAYKDEAQAVINAPDGGTIPVTSPDAFQQLSWNGPNAQNMGALQYFLHELNKHGGNLEILSGAGIQAPTATQEELLNTNSSKLVQFMQQESLGRTRELMRAVCWYEWHSRRKLNFPMPVEGMPGHAIPWAISPEERYGGGDSKFGRMQFAVHPYSMRPITPETRIAQWTKLWNEVIMPAAPMLAQMGYIPDVGAFAKYIAEQMDLPNFDEIVKFAQADPAMMGAEEGGGMQGAPRVRPPGTGQYTRTSMPTAQGRDKEILQMMNQGDAA